MSPKEEAEDIRLDDVGSPYKAFHVSNRVWSEKETSLFHRKGYNGFEYDPPGPTRRTNANFVHDLPGLRHISLMSPVGDDSAVFEVEELWSLALDYTSKRPADLSLVAPTIRTLDIGWRPNLHIPTAPNLLRVFVSRCQAVRLDFIADQPELRDLTIELKRRHTMSASKWPRLEKLREVEFLLGRVADLDVARLPPSIEKLSFHTVSDVSLDFIEALPNLETLFLEMTSVKSLAPLNRAKSLRNVSTYRIKVSDGDLSPLERFNA